jgi:hypothetical protein
MLLVPYFMIRRLVFSHAEFSASIDLLQSRLNHRNRVHGCHERLCLFLNNHMFHDDEGMHLQTIKTIGKLL